MSQPHTPPGPVEQSITSKLSESFAPIALEVINESFMHNVPAGSESHFKVVVVSDRFDEQTLIKRHRMINSTLQDELDAGLHALSIEALTPAQWQERDGLTMSSPQCRGGSKGD